MINVFYVDNGVGLTRDANIIKSCFDNVKLINIKDKINVEKADINIFLEVVNSADFDFNFKKYTKFADKNYLIPNQEWFFNEWLNELNHFDEVLCKTKYAFDIFSNLGYKTRFISFTSEDRFVDCDREASFFHGAGRSLTKNSDVILNLWNKIKFKPKLVFGNSSIPFDSIDGVETFTRLDDIEFKLLQNKYLFHLCPSLSEGFGHYINEAKSCGAIILTTDAPPMNELVKKNFGVLINYSSKEKRFLSDMYRVTEKNILSGIEAILNLDRKKIDAMRLLARKSFIDNDNFFRNEIKKI